jgi:uncharacterized membrane protein
LPTPVGWVNGSGHAVSADGSVIAGTLFDSPGQRRAFRWTAAAGTTLLDQRPGIVGSDATAISADGSAIVGWAYDATDVHRPFRWTATTGFQLLGGDVVGEATDATADGSVVIGNGGPIPGSGGAFLWDEAHGARDLKTALAQEYGLDLAGWQILSADAITPDGTVIVGRGSHSQFGENVAWRAVLPEPGAGALLVAGVALLVRRRRRR